MSGQLRRHYDVIINGGGIVGFTLLNLIQKSPQLNHCKVLLIEQAAKPSGNSDIVNSQNKPTFSNRVSSITSTSQSALKKIGVWDLVNPHVKEVKSIKVWNYDYSHKIIFQHPQQRDTVFSVLENNRLSTTLLKTIKDQQETILWNSSLLNMEESSDEGMVDAVIKNERTEQEFVVSAPLILGCDGFKSKVRELVQIKYRECDLKKTALVGTVRMCSRSDSARNDVAYQRFSSQKETVAALLPLDENYSSYVISAPSDYAKFLSDSDDETFIQEFNTLLSRSESPNNFLLRGIHEIMNTSYDNIQTILKLMPHFASKLDEDLDVEAPTLDFVVSESRASFPLFFGTTSPRMAASLPGLDRIQIGLLGDASHRVHPLAGQGLNLGIQDAVELVRQFESIAKTGEKVFGDLDSSQKALKRYERRRQAFVIPMSTSILFMQDLFKVAPSRMISSVNKCNPIKFASMKVANGL